jgi:hypothetical protein
VHVLVHNANPAIEETDARLDAEWAEAVEERLEHKSPRLHAAAVSQAGRQLTASSGQSILPEQTSAFERSQSWLE